MAKPTGFMEFKRDDVPHRPVDERVKDFFEVDIQLPADVLLKQAARCMDCGIPFCHGSGCPLNNRIPEFNDLIYRNRWREACEVLHSTNNFPEITGRICPALCEASCTLNLGDQPVLIKHIELQIVERGWQEGWIAPMPAAASTGRKVAVIGSGPAGLAAAQQLSRSGHSVTVFEKDDRVGGLLRYGIPDFKLEKKVLDRRLDQMRAEGVEFQTSVEIGEDISPRYLQQHFDAILLTLGAGEPRDLAVTGRGLENVHFAMQYLSQSNRASAGDKIDPHAAINAKDKIVAVIGGGDTGSDCVGTARRQGAREIFQYEILPQPPAERPADTPWPTWPRILRTSSSHEEGCTRRWSVLTKKLSGTGVKVSELHGVEVQWENSARGYQMKELPGTEFTQKADLVLLAMGFTHVVHGGLVEKLGITLDARGNVVSDANGMTTAAGVFAAGDAADGASLVVRAIASGRKAAEGIDRWLSSDKT